MHRFAIVGGCREERKAELDAHYNTSVVLWEEVERKQELDILTLN